MNDDSPPVLTEIKGAVAIVRFNRPRERNPLSVATLQALQQTASELFSRTDIEAVIFTGTADIFASGANIGELAQLDGLTAFQFSKFGQELFQTIADARPLTIAAINGYCMGGALDLALACDIRIASSDAIFSHPGARLGIITGWGGTQRLPRIVGRTNALEFMLTARRFTASDALRVNLITHAGDPILAYALELAEKKKVAEYLPPSVRPTTTPKSRS
jgi:enoyl-CoA hydratase